MTKGGKHVHHRIQQELQKSHEQHVQQLTLTFCAPVCKSGFLPVLQATKNFVLQGLGAAERAG